MASRPTQLLREGGQATGHGTGLEKAAILIAGSWAGESLKVGGRRGPSDPFPDRLRSKAAARV